MHESIPNSQNLLPAAYVNNNSFEKAPGDGSLFQQQSTESANVQTSIYDQQSMQESGQFISPTGFDYSVNFPDPTITEASGGGAELGKLQKAKMLFLGKLGLLKTTEVADKHLAKMSVPVPVLDKVNQIAFNPFYSQAPEGQKWAFDTETVPETVATSELVPEVIKPGEFVKPAPVFSEQVTDLTRTNPITYVSGQTNALGTRTEGMTSKTLTEHDSLVALQSYLQEMTKAKDKDGNHIAKEARSILEDITFIGKQEYDEATHGITDSWIQRLRDNPNLQICAVTGKITEGMVKSDAYLLDNILKNFSDEQLDEFSGRLVLDPNDLTAAAEDVSLIMLDDWTISGSQLRDASKKVMNAYPLYKDRIEIQLIAATKKRINSGFDIYDSSNWSYQSINIPIKAYYAAHDASPEQAPFSGAHITGAHCAVDYDFNNTIGNMSWQTQIDMPPATNIVRPYRNGSTRLVQRERLHRTEQREEVPKMQELTKTTMDSLISPAEREKSWL